MSEDLVSQQSEQNRILFPSSKNHQKGQILKKLGTLYPKELFVEASVVGERSQLDHYLLVVDQINLLRDCQKRLRFYLDEIEARL